MRDGLDVDVATLARLCVHASSLRGTTAIAEFAARTVGRLLELDSVQVDLRQEDAAFTIASFWRREAPGIEPLSSLVVERLARLEEDAGVAAAIHVFDLRESELVGVDDAVPWAVWCPLIVAGGTIGAINGRAAERPVMEIDRVEAATLFAQHAAALLDVSLALRREQRAAMTDSLTGLLNRRGFDERLREELDRATRSGVDVTLVLADCDDLKAINDRGGHELGDRMLQSVARTIRAGKRAEDTAARIGGDEFALILPGASPEAGLRIAERLRRDLRERPIGREPHVVATFGVATFPADGDRPAELLRAADRALYLAKRAGKNRSIAHPADAA
jgi:diguanylate cyclase (GGDEF)-like protein